MHTIRNYYLLTKPGIIRGNLLAALAGFVLAAKANVDVALLAATLGGTALVIASGCVFNNYLDRDIDRKMSRTKKRPLVTGEVSAGVAIAYATILGMAGLGLLAYQVNYLTCALGAMGLFFYVVVYGVAKRRGAYGTVVGSIAGAIPPAAGYTAVSGRLDAGAIILFAILVCWQMPHFYAIAMFRKADYAAAGLPVLPIAKGMRRTKLHILGYILAFIATAMLLAAWGYASWLYGAIVGTVGAIWLWRGIAGFKQQDDVRWARGMFFFSLAVLLMFCVVIMLDALLR